MQAATPWVLERDLPERVVIIGDLNGQYRVLEEALVGLGLMTPRGRWRGDKTVLIQMGDVVNRGAGARASMDLLLRLREPARNAGGEIYWFLGNHEVMSVLGHEAYVSAEEYLEFASQADVDRFFAARTRYVFELLGPPDVSQRVEPLGGRLKAWEEEHAPGRQAYRRAMGQTGPYGQVIRSLPVAAQFGSLLFVHGGLSPRWGSLGIAGLEQERMRSWSAAPQFYQDLPPDGLFRDPLGPIWHRAYCVGNASMVRDDLEDVLLAFDAKTMVVGHTRTDSVEGGDLGVPLVRHKGRLLMTDVGIGEPGHPGTSIVIEKGRAEAWTPGGTRSKIMNVKK